MSEPFIGEIRCFGFTFAPVDWAQCNGQLLPISTYETLFAVIGTTYGGDGTTNFALPNLQGQIPMHWGAGAGGFNTVIGQVQGQAAVTLTTNEIPRHAHVPAAATIVKGATGERSASPGSMSFVSGSVVPNLVYQTAPTSISAAFSNKAISANGGSLPHDNMQPYLVLNFCIALNGVFPPHS